MTRCIPSLHALVRGSVGQAENAKERLISVSPVQTLPRQGEMMPPAEKGRNPPFETVSMQWLQV